MHRTQYVNENGVFTDASHDEEGILFLVNKSTHEKTEYRHYKQLTEEQKEVIRKVIANIALHEDELQIFKASLIRTGEGQHVHYYPFPILLEQCRTEKAPRWMKRKYGQIKYALGIKEKKNAENN